MATKNVKTADTDQQQSGSIQYVCVDNVIHDGEYYQAGDSIELDDDQTEALLKIGAIMASISSKQEQEPAE